MLPPPSVEAHPRSSGARLQNFLYEPACYATSDEKHASRWITVIRDEEFIGELEVSLDLSTKCHAGFHGPEVGLLRVAESGVGRPTEMGVCEDRHGCCAGADEDEDEGDGRRYQIVAAIDLFVRVWPRTRV